MNSTFQNFFSFIRHYPLQMLCMMVALCPLTSSAGDSATHEQIRTVISNTYDKPEHKVETSPIAAIDDYAIADWTQGNRGGRALLHRSHGKWGIMACGADALKEVKSLTEAGIPQKTAEKLVSQLTLAEKSVHPNRLKLFSLFGTKNDPIQAKHHHPKH